MLLITAFIHTSQLAFPPTGNKECHAFWTVKVLQLRVHLQQSDTAGSGQQVGTCSTSTESQVAPLVEHGCLNATCSLGGVGNAGEVRRVIPASYIASKNSEAI